MLAGMKSRYVPRSRPRSSGILDERGASSNLPVNKPHRHNLWLWIFGATLMLFAASMLLIKNGRPPRNLSHDVSSTTSSYVDPQVCAKCHAVIAASYAQTGMGRSFTDASSTQPQAALDPGDFSSKNTFDHKASGQSYSMFERNGKWFERRQPLTSPSDSEGLGESDEKQIDYIIGSGTHARTFLHRTSEGLLTELPVSWYSENGGYWAMSPGYDQPHQADFRRAIGFDCMFCHNGLPEFAQPIQSTDKPVFPRKLPQGIDCQRCHGPGRDHVEAATKPGATVKQIRLSIVNPNHLDRGRQLDVCKQCHLETTSLQLPNSIQHYDRPGFSFRPGEALEDSYSFFDHKPGAGFDDRVEVAHQAYRLAKSACFQKSTMTCTTCHDPHRAPNGKEATAHMVAACTGCHQSVHPGILANSRNATCMDCHMWKRRTDDAVHVVMTDHYIQRRKPSRDFLAPLPERLPIYRDEVIAYDHPAHSSSNESLYLAEAQVEQDSDLKVGLTRFQQLIDEKAPAEPEFYFQLGAAYARTGDNTAAIRSYEEALAHRAAFPPALRELAVALSHTGNLSRAAQVAQQAVDSDPHNPAVLTNLGNIYLQQGRTSDAKSSLQKALAIDPDLPEANNLLALAFLRVNDDTEAEAAFHHAIRAEPDMASARINLANLLMQRGNLKLAGDEIKQAIRANPEDAAGYHAEALLLAMNGDYRNAVALGTDAVRLAPQDPEMHLDLADLLVAAGRFEPAEPEYQRAIQLSGSLPRAHLALANILTHFGRFAEAEQELLAAVAQNENTGEAHLELGRLLLRRGQIAEAKAHLRDAAQSQDTEIRQAATQALR
jgi:predicted CXXCH cytochrome family protein